MAVSLSNRKRIKRQKGPLPKKNSTAPNKRRPLAPVRQRRGGGRYADTTSRASNGDGGMALLNAVRSQGKLEALHDQSLKTIGNLEMRVGKAEATLRHKLDGHRVERDGDIGMRGMPPTVPLHDDDGASPSPASPTANTEMGTPPMPTPIPMGGTASPNPGAKQQPAQRVARTKSSMEVDSVSPSDFISKRPSTTTLSQPTSSRARVGGGNDGQLALSVAARAKPDRGRDDGDDEVLGNKKPKSHGFGTAQVSAITDGYKKMRADPSGVTNPLLALPPSTTGIANDPRKQHAVTARQFTQIASGEAAEDDD